MERRLYVQTTLENEIEKYEKDDEKESMVSSIQKKSGEPRKKTCLCRMCVFYLLDLYRVTIGG